MKILFVCRANVIRSQMAAALYNHLTGTKDADSAGTIVHHEGQTLRERAESGRPAAGVVIAAMQARGINVQDSKRTRLTPEMPARYDLVVNIADPAYTPDWLAQAPNYVYWNIPDPLGGGLALTEQTRDAIEKKITRLIASQRQ